MAQPRSSNPPALSEQWNFETAKNAHDVINKIREEVVLGRLSSGTQLQLSDSFDLKTESPVFRLHSPDLTAPLMTFTLRTIIREGHENKAELHLQSASKSRKLPVILNKIHSIIAQHQGIKAEQTISM